MALSGYIKIRMVTIKAQLIRMEIPSSRP